MCIRTVAIGRHESADKLCIEPIVGEIVFWNISENTCVWHRVLWKDKCIQTRMKELVHISDAGATPFFGFSFRFACPPRGGKL